MAGIKWKNRINYWLYNGKQHTFKELCALSTVNPTTLRSRLLALWDIDKALTYPANKIYEKYKYKGKNYNRKDIINIIHKETGISKGTIIDNLYRYKGKVDFIINRHNNKKINISKLAKEYGLAYTTLWNRLNFFGWNLEDALKLTPKEGRERGRKKIKAQINVLWGKAGKNNGI